MISQNDRLGGNGGAGRNQSSARQLNHRLTSTQRNQAEFRSFLRNAPARHRVERQGKADSTSIASEPNKDETATTLRQAAPMEVLGLRASETAELPILPAGPSTGPSDQPPHHTRRRPYLPAALLAALMVAGGLVVWRSLFATSSHPLTEELEALSNKAIEVNDRWDAEQAGLPAGPDRNRLFVETRNGLEEINVVSEELGAAVIAGLRPELDASRRSALVEVVSELSEGSAAMLEGFLGPRGVTEVRHLGQARFETAIEDLTVALDSLESDEGEE